MYQYDRKQFRLLFLETFTSKLNAIVDRQGAHLRPPSTSTSGVNWLEEWSPTLQRHNTAPVRKSKAKSPPPRPREKMTVGKWSWMWLKPKTLSNPCHAIRRWHPPGNPQNDSVINILTSTGDVMWKTACGRYVTASAEPESAATNHRVCFLCLKAISYFVARGIMMKKKGQL